MQIYLWESIFYPWMHIFRMHMHPSIKIMHPRVFGRIRENETFTFGSVISIEMMHPRVYHSDNGSCKTTWCFGVPPPSQKAFINEDPARQGVDA